MSQLKKPVILLFLTIISATHASPGEVHDIVDYGARPDRPRFDSSDSLIRAWAAACESTGSPTVSVPAGDFLVHRATFAGPCKSSKITVRIGGTLVAPSGYGGESWIVFDNVEGLLVYGGTIDGRGGALWACKAAGGRHCPAGATSLKIMNSKDVVLSGLTSVNSERFHVVIHGCEHVTVHGVRISAAGNSPNTDGIHVQMSTDVIITGASIRTGDDCVSIGPGTTNLWIEQVACGPGHGISIGSLGKEYEEKGVENVTVKTTVFTGTENGLRIKTWGRPSQGFVKGVVFENSIMQNVHNPIIIDQNYCPDHRGCPGKNSGVRISEVTYSDIHGSSATPVAVNFDCSASNPCTGIGLQNIKLTYGGAAAESCCKHADGEASGLVVPPSCL
ncbi:polygalacturonase-like [Zingiber officinale]|uniref:Exopolygalacturonase n=1 Tax=Zingiber officinale TaxID=94328 RepID=A0A8J5KVY6_ZINOF|nr:polygalacturonase-like [Zingiber officinale]KAG6491629.1 hypothetical protein ZIOFF_046561 [Zingiber officinale]